MPRHLRTECCSRGGLLCRLSGFQAPLDRKRDGHRGGFSRLEFDTTTSLLPLEAAGARADFLHEKKKENKKKKKRQPVIQKGFGPQ